MAKTKESRWRESLRRKACVFSPSINNTETVPPMSNGAIEARTESHETSIAKKSDKGSSKIF